MKHQHPSFRSLIPPWLRPVASGFACGLAVLCASVAIAADQEPSYDGRLLSEWLGDMQLGRVYLDGPPPPPVRAIQAMGTNAIPTLLQWMSYEPSPAELSRENSENAVHWRSITNLNRYPAQRGERAAYAFGHLGSAAHSTISELTQFARTAPNYTRAKRFAGALASIGREAVPSLISLTTNSPSWTRYSAVDALGVFADDPAVATPLVPMLIRCLSDSNTNTDFLIDGPVERLLTGMDPEIVVPALTNALKSDSIRTRQRAIACLFSFATTDPTNIPLIAVPAIRAAMGDPDPPVRDLAATILRLMGGWEQVGKDWIRRHGTNTLNGITPDFFTNAPPR